jgi:organic radical activating enzyme
LNSLPVENDFNKYDEIYLTGGEPLLFIKQLLDFRANLTKPVFVYTAMVCNYLDIAILIDVFDGITLTLHDTNDYSDFMFLDAYLNAYSDKRKLKLKSLRLNVFRGVQTPETDNWIIKDNIEWIKNSPLPENEVFMRLERLWRLK